MTAEAFSDMNVSVSLGWFHGKRSDDLVLPGD